MEDIVRIKKSLAVTYQQYRQLSRGITLTGGQNNDLVFPVEDASDIGVIAWFLSREGDEGGVVGVPWTFLSTAESSTSMA